MGRVTTPRIPSTPTETTTKRISAAATASNTKRITAAATASDTERARVPDPILTEANHWITCEVGSDYLECE